MKIIAALIAITASAIALAQTAVEPANQNVSWPAVTQFTDNTPISGTVTYILYKRTGTLTVEAKRASTNQYSDVSVIVPAIAGDCFYVVAVVAGVQAKPSPEACLGKMPKGVTAVTIKVSTP